MGTVAFQRVTQLFEQLALTAAEVDRGFHRHTAQQVTRTTTAHRRHTLATQAELLASLGAFRNLQLHATIKGRHFQLTTQGGIGVADGHFAVQVLAVALEDLVLTHTDHHVQVASRATMGTGLALAREADAVAGIDTCRHLDRQRLVFFDTPFAVARGARVGNDLALAMAARAGLLHREEALLHAHLTDAAARRAGRRGRTLLGTGTVARLAIDQGRNADADRGATYRFFQVQLQGVAQVAAALGTATSATTAAAKEVAEYITEDVGEVGATEAGTAAAHAWVDTGMAILVERRALAGIRQHFVGLVGLLEHVFRLFVTRVAVRVVLHRQTAVSLFEVSFTGAALDTQNLIVITLGHRSFAPCWASGICAAPSAPACATKGR